MLMNGKLRLMAALFTVVVMSAASTANAEDALFEAVSREYDERLLDLFKHFHKNPELSFQEHNTAARLSAELREAGFDVTEGVGRTGIVAILRNGDGPVVMVRADMDALPIEEKTGLSYASKVRVVNPITGHETPVMHACGHDIHIASLVGTARTMADMSDQWSGTLMLVGQPAEELLIGARTMVVNGLWRLFGVPDYAIAFHVNSDIEVGVINVIDGSPYAGADTVDLIIKGRGAHGAYPHQGTDPIVLSSQIVLALQTLVSRELAPRDSGVVTVGSFHAGSKHNVIPDEAVLQLTVRSLSPESRKTLLDGIRRIAENTARAAGVPEDRLPEMIISDEGVPPLVNDSSLVRRLIPIWSEKMSSVKFVSVPDTGMGAEDFSAFTIDPFVPSVYFDVGGTPSSVFREFEEGGPPPPRHHTSEFKVDPEGSIKHGVTATVVALLELMKPQ